MSATDIISQGLKQAWEKKKLWLIGFFATVNLFSSTLATSESLSEGDSLGAGTEMQEVLVGLLVLLVVIASVIANISLIIAAERSLKGQTITLKEAILQGRNLWFPALFFILFSQILGGVILRIFILPTQFLDPILRDSELITVYYPGIITTAYAALSMLWLISFVLEDRGIFRSLQKAIRLSRRNLGEVVVFVILLNLLVLIVGLVVSLGGVAAYFALDSMLSASGMLFAGIIVAPFAAAIIGFYSTTVTIAWTGFFKKLSIGVLAADQ